MSLHPRLLAYFALPAVCLMASCQYPQAPPPVTQEDREASAQRLREIEDENFSYRDRERRSAARAGYDPYYNYGRSTYYGGARPVW